MHYIFARGEYNVIVILPEKNGYSKPLRPLNKRNPIQFLLVFIEKPSNPINVSSIRFSHNISGNIFP
jgi:hypothetical protein